MIHIGQPQIVEKPHNSRLQAKVKIGNNETELWFEVSKEYGEYLVDDRADAFVVALVNYAMIHGFDIRSEAPLSQKLLYQLKDHYIPTLSLADTGFRRIELDCTATNRSLKNAGAVGCGMSCGVDALTTLYLHSEGRCTPGYEITHLTFFNVGAAMSANRPRHSMEEIYAYENKAIRERTEYVNRERFKKVEQFARSLGFPIVRVESNIMEVARIDFSLVHPQRNCAAVLALQKLFKAYYISSGVKPNDLRITAGLDASYYDVFAVPMFSTDAIQFYSSGGSYSRVEKTKMLCKYAPSYTALDVCWRDLANCGECGKCVRTLVTLDLLGRLDRYASVFDLKEYEKNRERNIAQILVNARTDPLAGEVADLFRKSRPNLRWHRFAVYYALLSLFMLAKRAIPRKTRSRLRIFGTRMYRALRRIDMS